MADSSSDALISNRHIRVKQCRYGPMAYNATDDYVGRSFDLYGEYAEEEVNMLRQVLQPGMAALDIGANIGAHTIPMAQLVHPGGAVAAFEPQREVFQVLAANVALNALHNVHTYHSAVGAQPGEVIVPMLDYEKGGNFGGISLGDHQKGERVPCRTIDSMNLPQCHMMKVDVEGMETEVLRGASATITRHRPIMYLENDRRNRSEELLTYIFSLDYKVFWHLPRLYSAENFFGNNENVFSDIISRNIICIPAERGVMVQGLTEITDPTIKF